MDKASLGRKGEDLSAEYYETLGYTVLERNYRVRQGEIDLVLLKDGILVFAEVKTRGPSAIATPAAFVTAPKQQRLILAAQQYIQQNCQQEPICRFDVVEVTIAPNKKPNIHCIENAFTA